MKKMKSFKILFQYLKDEKVRLFLYILLVVLSYLPSLLGVYYWGLAVEKLVLNDFNSFVFYLIIMSSINILFYSILQIPRDSLYNYLEIKFTKNVSKDLYKKIDCLPARSFEEIGVGEFINRLYTDPDRIMQLLQKMIRLICKSIILVVVLVIAFSTSWILFL